MAKLTPQQQDETRLRLNKRLNVLRGELAQRLLKYDLRRGFIDGTIQPVVERGHDLIYTQYAATIVDKFAAYFMGNGLTIKLKPTDVSDATQVIGVEKVNSIIDELYNNEAFMYELFCMAQTSGWSGDGYLGTSVEKGIPRHFSIDNPRSIMIGFRDDTFREFNMYVYEHGVDVDDVKETFGIDVAPMPITTPGFDNRQSTHRDPYADRLAPMLEGWVGKYVPMGMAKHTVVYDFNKGKRTQYFNDIPTFEDSKMDNLYHFLGNQNPGSPYGDSDFETVAQLITKIEEVLSEESDAVSSSVHPKIITNKNARELQEKWKPNKTQAFEVKNNGTENGRLEILNVAVNPTNSERLLSTLMNALRTGSGLQELGQDQIAANVSGRAIAYMFQGVIQKIKAKQRRLNVILTQMVLDDLEILAKSAPDLKGILYDDGGKFRYKIQVKYPPVLEQDEQIRIANISSMLTSEIISKFTSRTLLSDYVDDPSEEEKRIQQEKETAMQNKIKEEQAIAQAQQPQQQAQAAQPQQGQPSGIPAVSPQMEPSSTSAGAPSTPGNPGGAQSATSAPGAMAQAAQQAAA